MRFIAIFALFILLGNFLKGAQPPNIVLILSDDQAWTDYGHMGHPHIETPHLDKLAARSAVFKRGYVPTALCRPALMTLTTGLYAHQHLVSGNDPSPVLADPKKEREKYDQLRAQLIANVDKHPTIARLLGQSGYLSHQSGKWWEGNFSRGGFTHGMTQGFPNKNGRHGDAGLKIGREGMAPVFEFIDHAVGEKKPFYLWYAPMMPHSPHTPPEDLLKKYQAKVASIHVARYYAMCEWFDQTCGQLIDYLDKKGQTENTLIVYVCDNGWIQSEDSPQFAPRSKQSPNEGGVRHPIMFSLPGKIQPGDRGDQLCSSIDIVPTMFAAADLIAPGTMPGFNLLPCLENASPSPRQEVLGEGFAHDIANLEKPDDSLLYRWIVEGKWKLILSYDGTTSSRKPALTRTEMRPQLFDLSVDPHENTNLAAANPELVARLAARIAAWWPSKRAVLTKWE
jgi:arylsulfatase A-like enzyme